jgi:RND family efflux transporter MFP subunit
VAAVSVPERISVLARLEADQPRQLSSRVLAPISAVHVEVGQAFQAGELLIELEHSDASARLAQAEAQLRATEAEAQRASQAHTRNQGLHGRGAVTDADLQSSSAAQASALAAVERASQAVLEAQAALDHYRLYASSQGVLLERWAQVGDLAMPGQPLLAAFDPQDLLWIVALPSDIAQGLKPGQSAQVAELQALAVDAEAPIAATSESSHSNAAIKAQAVTLKRLHPGVDARGLVRTEWQVAANSGAAQPGLPTLGALGRLELEIGQRSALLIPSAARQSLGQLEFVECLVAGQPQRRLVRTGAQHGADLEVLSGLSSGEQVWLP